VAGNRWPPMPEGALSQVWAAYLTLDRTQWLDPADLERHRSKSKGTSSRS
jgi:hypothetical protein